MEDYYIIVGRQQVLKSEAKCIQCGDPFKNGVNVFTREGHAEIAISGVCERCFDALFEDDEE
jgi:hypothetical protein